MHKYILGLILLFSLHLLKAQDKIELHVLFWNVENLFDCKHDSLKNDYDFLPTSLKHWNTSKYWNKQKALAKGIIAAGGWNPPALVGLCEVENDSVIYDLTRRTALRKLGYRYLVTQSADSRGIDVALLYQPEFFQVLKQQSISVGLLPVGKRASRDLLHVSGRLWSQDTLDIFVVHLPSRYGGQAKSEPNRIYVARQLKQHIDSLFQVRQTPNILVMGDFNDYPHNASVQKILQAKAPGSSCEPHKLYNLLARKRTKKHWGTYKYKNHWGVLDQFIVSGQLLQAKATCRTSESDTQIVKLPFLLIEDTKYGGYKPFRTYNGMRYQGGFSDHLPVLSKFVVEY